MSFPSLILAAGAASAGVGGREQPNPALPAVAALLERGDWQVETAYEPGEAGMSYRQWLLRDAVGGEALLYVGATSHVQVMARWTAELGFQGEGYVVAASSERTIRLDDGSTAAVSAALVRRLDDRRLLVSAVVRRDGVVPAGTSSPLATAWDVLAGRAGPYYLVRVAVPEDRSEAADALLAAVLPPLSARARAG